MLLFVKRWFNVISKIVNLKLFVRMLGGDIDGGFIEFSI